MIPYKLDFTIEKVLANKSSHKDFNADFYTKSAWRKLQDHKWYLSERLGRDVGFFVAASDYFLNFYKLPFTPNRKLMT